MFIQDAVVILNNDFYSVYSTSRCYKVQEPHPQPHPASEEGAKMHLIRAETAVSDSRLLAKIEYPKNYPQLEF